MVMSDGSSGDNVTSWADSTPGAGHEDVTNPAFEESSFHIKLVPAMDQYLLHRYSCIFPTWLWLDPWPQAYLWTHRDGEAAFWCQL